MFFCLLPLVSKFLLHQAYLFVSMLQFSIPILPWLSISNKVKERIERNTTIPTKQSQAFPPVLG
jgi:uncharacterized membrane protein